MKKVMVHYRHDRPDCVHHGKTAVLVQEVNSVGFYNAPQARCSACHTEIAQTSRTTFELDAEEPVDVPETMEVPD